MKPNPPSAVQTNRTFRNCAKDPLWTCYHEQSWIYQDKHLVTFKIVRGSESLIALIQAKTPFPIEGLLLRGPVVHNGPTVGWVADGRLVPSPLLDDPRHGFGWQYDGFGDFPFSGLKVGGYRPNEAKEWGTQDVYLDSIDEVRRVLGFGAPPERRPEKAKPAGVTGRVVRKILLWTC